MMQVSPQEALVLDGLRSLVASGDVPSSLHRSCEGLLERLDAPIRIGIFGVPGSGKKDVLNTLMGATIASSSPLVPTLELLPGAVDHTTAILPDGATLDLQGYPDAELLTQLPVFLSVSSRICAQDRRAYVLAVCDDTYDDMVAGLHWAAQRVDLAIWCTDSWTELEAEVWGHAPPHLRDHSILCCTAAFDDEPCPPIGFDSVFRVMTGAADRYASLEGHVEAVIEAARAQDILAAELFLRRYTDLDMDMALSAPAIGQVDGAESEASEMAHSQLASLFRYLRSAAETLRQTGPQGAEMLGPLDGVFEQLAERATEYEAIGAVWPEIPAAVGEARDLAVLLRLEGGSDQAADAARLLLQLRWDMESRLAA